MALKVLSNKISEQTFRKLFDISAKRSVSGFFEWDYKDSETHTGQKWSSDDYRLSRFQNKSKQVNPNWAIKLVAEAPPIPVQGRIAVCDGGMGATGHPKVYINVDKPGCHPCLYCGLRYYQQKCDH